MMRGKPRVSDRWLFRLAVLGAIAYPLVARAHVASVAVKVSMCLLLAIYASRAGSLLLTVALVFSAAGDAFLAVDAERLFVPGLASFLVTHALYAIAFHRAGSSPPRTGEAARRVMGVLVPIFAVTYAIVLHPRLGPLAAPVVTYIGAIVVMALASLRVPSSLVPLGAALFVASDALIALGRFLYAAPWIDPLVWVTYALAQLLIARGMHREARASLRP